MRLNLYQDDGYLNMPEIIGTGIPFIFITGARGTGKTYGALKWQLPRDEMFIYMRRTEKQVEAMLDPDFNPLLPLNKENGWSYVFDTDNKKVKIFDGDTAKALVPALSTIANIRGIDNPDLKRLIYDEFIPESHEKRFKNEGGAFKSAIETINRNRELSGGAPMQVIAMANSNDIGNPLYLAFKIITPIIEMRRKDYEYRYLKDRGILLIDIRHSPISERKAQTALYRACGDDDEFVRMAIHNEFVGMDDRAQISRPLSQYCPIVAIGELVFYKHKSKSLMYVTGHKSGTPREYTVNPMDIQRFKHAEREIINYYLERKIEFEQYFMEVLLLKYLNIC